MNPWTGGADGWTGVVLAGGRSSRMGRDKALIEVDGRTLLDRALDKLEPHVQELLVIGDPGKYGHVGPFVFADDIPGVGPLGGILTAMRYASNDRLLVLACDMPNVTPRLFEHLKEGLTREGCRSTFEARVAQGAWKVSDALEQVRATFVQICPGEEGWPQDLFRNINAPGDL
jgi:molybdenum cofactor guanylyltransferase